MSDLFKLRGSITTDPAHGDTVADEFLAIRLEETCGLAFKQSNKYLLSSDSLKALDLSEFGASGVNVVVVVSDGHCTLTLTSAAAETAQIVPVDDLAIVISRTVPFTAIGLTRFTGVATNVKVFLGQIT